MAIMRQIIVQSGLPVTIGTISESQAIASATRPAR
jgi:hypothetical protein